MPVKGRPLTKEHKRKISVALKKGFKAGSRKSPRPFTDEHRKNLSIAQKKRKRTPLSEEHKRNLSISHAGYKMPEEQKKKIGAANKGRKFGPMSEEHKQKLRDTKGHRKPFSSETIKNMSKAKSGSGNAMWRGGISFEPYDLRFNNSFKTSIRNRDNNSCFICGLDGKDVHHIDYNKQNTIKENCITLCRRCHLQTNHNRNYWKQKLTSLIIKRVTISQYMEEDYAQISP